MSVRDQGLRLWTRYRAGIKAGRAWRGKHALGNWFAVANQQRQLRRTTSDSSCDLLAAPLSGRSRHGDAFSRTSIVRPNPVLFPRGKSEGPGRDLDELATTVRTPPPDHAIRCPPTAANSWRNCLMPIIQEPTRYTHHMPSAKSLPGQPSVPYRTDRAARCGPDTGRMSSGCNKLIELNLA